MTPPAPILGRLYFVFAALLLLPAGVLGKMLQIHFSDAPELREQGSRQASSFVEIPAVRGAILDRHGRALVANAARYDVALDPTARGYAERHEEVCVLLGRLTSRPAAHYRERISNRTSRQYVVLVRDLEESQKEALEAADIPGLLLEPKFARRYHYGRLASHVLGHVSGDHTGAAGIELQYESILAGVPGRRGVKRDRRGIIKVDVGGAVTPPSHGDNVVLTLDLVRQSIVEEELARGVAETGAEWATAIAMDPHTGEILAMANVPDYDPNRPAAFNESSRRNHAVVDQIEPGSTFKLVTAIAAIEHLGMAATDTVDAGQGSGVFGGRPMRDARAYGRLSFGDALRVSSNVAMARTAQQFEPGDFYQTARGMGFGQPTWIDLPGETSGLLHRPTTWSRTSQTSMAIGYGVAVTPLQLLVAYAALGNGGTVVRPHLLREQRDIAGRVIHRVEAAQVRRAFRAETAQALMPYFEGVVSDSGTARRARVEGLRIAGKTGTARIARAGGYTNSYRATFAGLFPADNPQIAMVVVMHAPQRGAYGGLAAAPVFGRIAERWVGTSPLLASRINPAEALPNRHHILTPPVAGLPVTVAASRIRAEGVAATVRGAGWIQTAVGRHSLPDTLLPGQPLRIQAEADTTARVMPDLTGLSSRQAYAYLAALGVRAQIRGSGSVRTQEPAAGAPLPARAVVDCR
ncbi:penicillin-binding transpeptidase domain-containing protein [soil metagenome]